MKVDDMIRPRRSAKGSDCAICELPIEKGERVLAAEKKIGVGVLSKTLVYEVHIPCITLARDVISRKISEAEAL